ncbi:hypothetical protein [Chryseobacterium tongliaoense]|uniref:hypothetical protein n=1 Tax=Chryseobacterium tongliaoense TaxID=3240933 RepID=UPI003517E8A6
MKKKKFTYLLGRTRIEVKDKLGYGLNYFGSDLWTYELGKDWMGKRIFLSVVFKNEEVAEINIIKRFRKY